MKKIFIPLALGLLFVGCSQDRLDIPQKGVISIDDFYQTPEDAKMALTAAYDQIATSYVAPLYNDNIIYALWNYPGDDMYAAGNNKTDNVGENELNALRFPVNNGLINSGYSGFFRSVYAANLVISKFKDNNDSDIKKIVAEAKVLRALSYLQLAIGWGTPPIVEEPLAATDKPTNAESQTAVLDFIINSIDDATLALVDERKSPQDEDGAYKATRGLGYTIRAKAKMWKGDYAGAKSDLEKVMNSGKYELVPAKDLENLFHVSGDGAPEWVFQLNLVYDPSVSGYTSHSTANMPWLWNWRQEAVYHPDGAESPMKSTAQGWGGCNPSKKFAEALIENDGLESARRKAWIKTYDEVLYEMPYSTDDKNGGFTPGKTNFKETDPLRGIKRAAGIYGHAGYFMWKVNIQKQDLASNNARMQNIRIFRYAEVLLMYAECCAQTGTDLAKGLEVLNSIQQRAGSKTISSELTLAAVKKEKMLEMWLEGCRYQDLIRWGDTDELANNGKYYPSFTDEKALGISEKHIGVLDESDANWCEQLYKEVGFKKGKHEFFPFPFAELAVNPNIKQNPGYGE